MGEKIKLSIRGLLTGEDTETGDLETKVDAEFFQKGKTYYFFYEEQPDGFEQKCKSCIKYKDNVLELARRGLVETRMVFEKDVQHMTRYVVPYGEIMLGIRATEVSMDIFIEDSGEGNSGGNNKETDQGNNADTFGRIRIVVEYDLEMDGEHQSHNKIEINAVKI